MFGKQFRATFSMRPIDVKRRPFRAYLKFVISLVLSGGAKENLKNVFKPKRSIMFCFRSDNMGVFHFRKEIEVIQIPGELDVRRGLRELVRTGDAKRRDASGFFPDGVVGPGINFDGRV